MLDPIMIVKGKALSSVEFVQDYVQLRFDGPCLKIEAPFKLFVSGQVYEKGRSGYRDAICERIGHYVDWAATSPELHVLIEFDDQSKLEISLNPKDQMGPEAAVLTDSENFYVW